MVVLVIMMILRAFLPEHCWSLKYYSEDIVQVTRVMQIESFGKLLLAQIADKIKFDATLMVVQVREQFFKHLVLG